MLRARYHSHSPSLYLSLSLSLYLTVHHARPCPCGGAEGASLFDVEGAAVRGRAGVTASVASALSARGGAAVLAGLGL